MRQDIPENAVKAILELVTGKNEQDEEQAARQEQTALDTLENLLESRSVSTSDQTEVSEEISSESGEKAIPENPIQWMKDVKKKRNLYIFDAPGGYFTEENRIERQYLTAKIAERNHI